MKAKETDSKLKKLCLRRYGSLKQAATMLEVPYATLIRNCKKPSHGWKLADEILGRYMTENDGLREKIEFLEIQYAQLTREYNDLVERVERKNLEERI